MIFAIIGFNRNKETRFCRCYEKDIDVEYIKSKYVEKDICIRYLPNFNVVYHRYAETVISFAVDKHENVLLISNVITRMMQALDALMNNVCELNLIYSLDKVYALIDGFVCKGKILDMEPLKIASHGHC